MKINKRLIQIAILSLLIALGISTFLFSTIKKASEPEPTERIAYFKIPIEKGMVFKKEDIDKYIEMIPTPKSRIPKTAVRDTSQIIDKRLTVNADAGEYVLIGKFIERGDVRVDITKLWTIGLDVKNISNYLGGNLKEGGDYLLLYISPEKAAEVISEIKIANMVDTNGRPITETGDGLIKTVNVSVQEQDTMMKIAALKDVGTFEIVDSPEGYKVPQNVAVESE